MIYNKFLNKIIILMFVFLVAACSSIDKSIPISHIDVVYRGKNLDNRPQMASVCKGFFLSDKQVKAFYYNAARINEKEPGKKYEILPCYSTGTAYIYGVKYNWVIRAGGVGEFYNDKDRFIKICGKKCCSKVKRIC